MGSVEDNEISYIKKEEEHIKEEIQHLEHKEHIGKSGKENPLNMIKNKLKPKYIYSFIAFLVLALVILLPITAHINSVAPGTGGDTYQNLWDIWWVGYATFTLHTSMWYTNLLYAPIGAGLAFQTMAPIASLLSVPFQALGLVTAYNILLLLGFAVSGLTMFILADYLVKNSYAAFIAGLVFAFSSFHMAEALSHIDWMFIAWIPLAVYFFIKMLRAEKPILNGIGLGIVFMLSEFMGDVEQSIMLVLLFVIMLIIFLLYGQTRKKVLNIRFAASVLIFLLVAFLVGSFGYIPLIKAVTQPGALSSINSINNINHNMLWSDNLLSFFLPSPFNGVFHNISLSYYSIFANGPTEDVSYITYTVLVLAAYGIYKDHKRTGMWIAIAVIFGLLALGPYIQMGTGPAKIPGLYYAYTKIPVLNIIREPGRFDVVVEMALAIIAAFGAEALLEHHAFKGKTPRIMLLVGVITIIFLIESTGILNSAVASTITTQVAPAPGLFYQIGKTPLNFSILNLPALENSNSAYPSLYTGEATYYTAITHKPLVGGYTTRNNLTDEELLFNIPLVIETSNLQTSGQFMYQSPVSQDYTNQTLLALYNYNTALLTVNLNAFNNTSNTTLMNYLTNVFGKPLVQNSTAIFPTNPAINYSLYKGYVSFPILTEWGVDSALVNGSIVSLWSPINNGAIIVYAPYANTTNIQEKIAEGSAPPINTTISFYAEAYPNPTVLYLEGVSPQGNLQKIAQFYINDSKGLERYTANTVFYSGPRIPNTVLFVTSNSTPNYVLLNNITFSK